MSQNIANLDTKIAKYQRHPAESPSTAVNATNTKAPHKSEKHQQCTSSCAACAHMITEPGQTERGKQEV